MMDTQNVIILDVREQNEFNAGYIKYAVLLPIGSITEAAAASVIPDLDSKVLFFIAGAETAVRPRLRL